MSWNREEQISSEIQGKRQITWWIEKKQKPIYTQVFALFASVLNFRTPWEIVF